MIIKKFEEIEAWKEGRLFVKDIYYVFRNIKDTGFKNQIQRATVSIMSNIAEGFDRGSNKEFIQYMIVARSSNSEVKSLGYAALDLGYINDKTFQMIEERCLKINNLINGFIRYLRKSTRKS